MLNVSDQYCISPATSKGGFSCHPGDLSRKCHLCHGSCKSRKRGTRPPSSHYKTVRNIFSLPLALFYPREWRGGCALTFAEIMFLCIWFSQLYRVFSHDVTAAILVSQTMKKRPCWCPKPILFSYVNALFCSNKFA